MNITPSIVLLCAVLKLAGVAFRNGFPVSRCFHLSARGAGEHLLSHHLPFSGRWRGPVGCYVCFMNCKVLRDELLGGRGGIRFLGVAGAGDKKAGLKWIRCSWRGSCGDDFNGYHFVCLSQILREWCEVSC